MPKKRDKQRQIEDKRQQKKKERQLKKQIRKKMYSRTQNFKLSKEYIEQFSLFNKEIAMLKIKLRDVGGDGNCLFRAFADQIDGDELAHGFMRQQACNHILKNADFFRPFLDEDEEGTLDQYIKMMKKNGQWGGHFQLQALSQCFRCIIVIHKRHLQEVIIKPILNAPEGGIIHLAYFQTQDFEHYLSIRDFQDDSQRPAAEKLRPLNKNMYQKLLYEDQEEYMMIKQIQQLEMIEKAEKQMGQQNQYQDQAYKFANQEPYPNYPRNKKCKCGSKLAYKSCCFKQYQKKIGKNIY